MSPAIEETGPDRTLAQTVQTLMDDGMLHVHDP